MTCKLTALIGIEYFRRTLFGNGFRYDPFAPVRLHRIGNIPTNDHSMVIERSRNTVYINDCCQIHKTGRHTNIRYVHLPDLIAPFNRNPS